MSKFRLSKAIRGLPLALAATAAVFAVSTGGKAEAEPQADPQAVQLYLAQLEASQAALDPGAEEKRPGADKNLHKFVEGAATRAPSDAFINRIENVVVGGQG